MRIATWNVNSVNARLPTVLAWLEAAQPDVVGFQEIKCLDEKFPREAFESLGYNVETHGQKTYNGVALLSKYPLSDVRRGLPGANGGAPVERSAVRREQFRQRVHRRLRLPPPAGGRCGLPPAGASRRRRNAPGRASAWRRCPRTA